MTKPKPKPKPKPKTKTNNRGGKPGNQNARKHGLWAKNHIAPKANSRTTPEERLEIVDEIIQTLYTKFSTYSSLEDLTKCANTIFHGIDVATSCERLILLRDGNVSPLSEAIERLLLEEDPHDNHTISQ